MEFPLRIDDAARVNLSELNLERSILELTDSELHFQFGVDFEVRAPLSAVSGADVIPGPQPEAYLPHGISEAVDTLGRETIAAIGALDGLVAVNFAQPIDARTRPPEVGGGEDVAGDQGPPVKLRRLIVSPADPDAFARAVTEGAGPANAQ